jgi:hypothetical protein
MQKYNPADKSDFLKWVHVMISNIKSNIEGTYHGLDNNYLQIIWMNSATALIAGT